MLENSIKYMEIVRNHLKNHPGMECQDMLKLCFQGSYGPGHLLKDKEKAYRYLLEEYADTPEAEGEICEEISENFVRINIAPYKKEKLPPEWLFQMFFLTANMRDDKTTPESEGMPIFNRQLKVMNALAEQGECPFSNEEWQTYMQTYLGQGGGAVHHTETYRRREKPSYRVVHKKYGELLPILKLMAAYQEVGKEVPGVLSIEGRAAAGKTTCAKLLAEVTGAGIISMDDFFLPPELRTQERYAQAGGNVHYERIREEVLPHLKENKSFSYRAFECSKMSLGHRVEIPASPWRIVEGVYSMHPKLGKYADVTVFMNVDKQLQMGRILQRNGEGMAKQFQEKWIPLEENYFLDTKVQEAADIVVKR